jgi:hypothetical protein
MNPVAFLASLALPLLLLYIYIRINDAKLMNLPHDTAKAFSPDRITEDEIKRTFLRMQKNPISVLDRLPPKTGRNYIVVGGVSTY